MAVVVEPKLACYLLFLVSSYIVARYTVACGQVDCFCSPGALLQERSTLPSLWLPQPSPLSGSSVFLGQTGQSSTQLSTFLTMRTAGPAQPDSSNTNTNSNAGCSSTLEGLLHQWAEEFTRVCQNETVASGEKSSTLTSTCFHPHINQSFETRSTI